MRSLICGGSCFLVLYGAGLRVLDLSTLDACLFGILVEAAIVLCLIGVQL